MTPLYFVTTNDEKFAIGQETGAHYGLTLLQKSLEIDEIQGEDPAKIACDKAAKAQKLTGHPVIVSDDSWAFAGLNGFPGAYMHAMNVWFTPQDFLNLTHGLKDRRVTLTQYLVYDDGKQQKVFTAHTPGELLQEARGSNKHPSHTVITLQGDHGQSIAEVLAQRGQLAGRLSARVWHEFCEWFAAQTTAA